MVLHEGGGRVTFQVHCSSCQSTLSVKDEFKGKTAKCPKCSSKLHLVPAVQGPSSTKGMTAQAKPSASPPVRKTPATKAVTSDARDGKRSAAAVSPAEQAKKSKQALQSEILSAFQSQIEPVRPPLVYRFGVFLAALAMIMLPIIYVALIALTAYLVYWHMTNNIGILGYGNGRGKIFVIMAYLAPLIGGVTMVIVMVKPFFAKSIEEPPRRSLTAAGEPILFAFVKRICEAVRAPVPKRIDVDCDVNASASFRRGTRSMIAGNDLVLTIGMPLVAGMSMRQFGGVLAHEFGHFSQGAGMRLSYIVRVISMWFTRVVYGRDEMDESLRSAAGRMDIRIGWVFYVALLCVWLTRRILWVLMMVGHLISSFLLRQMEFDADRYEARLAGSETFESTCRRLREVGMAFQSSVGSMQESLDDKRLGDDLPKLLSSRLGHITPEIAKAIHEQSSESKTNWLDTHPCDSERIASAYKEASEGIFQLERPASDLFCNYDALSKNVTWDFYRHSLGPDVKKSDLYPIEEAIRRDGERREAMNAVDQYFMGCYQPLRPFPFPTGVIRSSPDAHGTLAKLNAARKVMQESHVDYGHIYKRFAESDGLRIKARLAKAQHRVQIKPDQSSFPGRNAEETEQFRQEAEANMVQLLPLMQPFEQAAGERLECALTLTGVVQVQQRMKDPGTKRKQAISDFTMLCGLRGAQHLEAISKLRDENLTFGILLSHLGNYEHEKLINVVLIESRELSRRIGVMRNQLSSIAYPFAEGKAKSVGEHFVPVVPGENDVGDVYQAVGRCIDRHEEFVNRLLSRLVVVAQEVETALGLEPMAMNDESQ